jgi:excisionase family DNA binding protein
MSTPAEPLEPLALSPRDAAALLGVSKRTLTRLIAAKRIMARKSDHRTLVDVGSLKTYYASLPAITQPAPLYCSIPKPKHRRSKTQH